MTQRCKSAHSSSADISPFPPSCCRIFHLPPSVLPKFEVILNPPSYVLFDQTEDVNVEICASYSYGQPVRGKLDFKMSAPRKESYRYDYWARFTSKPARTYAKSGDFYDCETISVSTQELGLGRPDFHETIDIEASVTEEGTGECLKCDDLSMNMDHGDDGCSMLVELVYWTFDL